MSLKIALQKETDVLLLQLETPIDTSEHAIEIAKANETIVILDPAPARPLPASLLSQVDILKPNEVEAGVLSRRDVSTPEEGIAAAKVLQSQIASDGISAVVLTLGEHGVLVHTKTQTAHIPPMSVEVVDTTGAGDAFSGALATALAEDKPLIEAVKFANAAGAAAVTTLGATPSMPTRERIKEILSNT